MLGVGVRARAPVAASSAERGHHVRHAPCSAHLAELARSSAAAAIIDVTTIVALGDYILTRVNTHFDVETQSLMLRGSTHARQTGSGRGERQGQAHTSILKKVVPVAVAK